MSGNIAVDEQCTRTLDDVCKCAGELTGVQGLAAVLNLLKSYNATRICEVPEKQYADFVDRCAWLMSNTD